MSMRFKGGIISATPPTTTGGEYGTASGAWTLQQQMQAQAASLWPTPLFSSGQAWVWGTNEGGQLGRGSSTTYFVSSPVQLGSLNWKSSAVGENFLIATRDNGTLWSWGKNDYGNLGLGDENPRSSPTQIGALTNWGAYNVAGNNFAGTLTASNALWVWGSSNYGQLGQNNTTTQRTPVQISGTWIKISAGRKMFLGIKSNGTLWSWGYSQDGVLGLNNTTSYSSPKQVGSDTNWAEISTRANSSAAIKTDGTLWTWGNNYLGKLGINSTINKSSPTQVGSDTNWSKVLVINETMFALKTNGTLWAWGMSHQGQRGSGNTANVSSPVQIGALTNWKKIGGAEASGFAIKTDGTLWSWGRNDWGQLGINTNSNTSSPVQVGALTTWAKLQNSAGNSVMVLKS